MKRSKFLDLKIRDCYRREQEVLTEVLPYIKEMMATRGYESLDCKCIYSYLLKVGYSDNAARRRIAAAELIKDVPDLVEKIGSGAINMTQVMFVKSAITQAGNATPEQKRAVFDKIEKLNEHVSQRTVAAHFDLPVIEKAKRRVQKDGSVIYEITVSKELDEKIQRTQERYSHKVPSMKFTDLIAHFVDEALDEKPKTPSTARRDVTPKMREEVLRDAEYQCEYIHDDGRRCNSRYQVEVDHKQARHANGASDRKNLQAYCRRHNQIKYRREVGLSDFTVRYRHDSGETAEATLH